MPGKTQPIGRAKIKAVSAVRQEKANLQLSKKVLDNLKARGKQATENEKMFFKFLTSSIAARTKLTFAFFKGLPERLALVGKRTDLRPEDLGFNSWEEFSAFITNRIIYMQKPKMDIKNFIKDLDNRKWSFIGKNLWELYVKYGPVRRFLNKTAQAALFEINKRVLDKSIIMYDAKGKPVSVQGIFKDLSAGMEYSMGSKAYLDFGHMAFNPQGYCVIPTPTEIKLPTAARKAPNQFSEFIQRLQDDEKLMVTFDGSDFSKVQKYFDPSKLTKETANGRDMVKVEIDPKKILFVVETSINQTVVKPATQSWGTVKKAQKSPDVDIDIAETSKGFTFEVRNEGSKIARVRSIGFNFWINMVDVSRAPFEMLYEAIFLGQK